MTIRNTVTFLLKLAVSVGLLTWLISGMDTDALLAHINVTTMLVLLLLAGVLVATSVVLAYRWLIILGYLKTGIPLFAATKNVLVGFFFNQFFPSTVGGDVVRVWLAKKHGLAITTAMFSIVSDRIFGFVGLVLLCAAGLPFMMAMTSDPVMVFGEGLLILAVAGGMAVLVILQYVPDRWLKTKLFSWMAEISNASAGVMLKSGSGLQVLAISFALHILDVSMLYLMALATGIEVGFLVWLVLIPPAILVSAAPISIAGWGVREGAMALSLSIVGVSAADAVLLSLSYGTAQLIAGLVGGIIWLTNQDAKRNPDP